MLAAPEIVSRGFVYMRDSEELIAETKALLVKETRKFEGADRSDYANIKSNIRASLKSFLKSKTKRTPMIMRSSLKYRRERNMVYDTAHKLAEELKASEEYVTYAAAREQAMENATTRALIDEYNKLPDSRTGGADFRRPRKRIGQEAPEDRRTAAVRSDRVRLPDGGVPPQARAGGRIQNPRRRGRRRSRRAGGLSS
jgi:hypothetical protein